MNDPGSLPTLASVVFARITEFVRRPVAEQARLRAQLEAALAVALGDTPADCRLILDAPDGTALAVLGDPVAALDIARRWLSATQAGLPVAMAINHGAIRLAADDSGHQGVIGDAVGTAAAIARFAGPSKLFVSRAFHDALAEIAPARAATLRPAGVFTDANVRTHELLAPEPGAQSRRRRMLAAVGVTVVFAMAAALIAFHDEVRRELRAGQRVAIAFDIHPDGDVFVDGVARGRTPPLGMLRLEPGLHGVEVRKKGHPSYRASFDIQSGRTVTVTHDFVSGGEHGLPGWLPDWMR